MIKWTKDRHGDRRADLGHGLVLAVWYEGFPDDGQAKYNVSVFGQRLVSRSEDIAGGKRRAEAVAHRWAREVMLRLSGSID